MDTSEPNIKRGLTFVINGLKTQESNNLDYVKILTKVRDRLNSCPHCGGETDDSGKCLESFSIA